MKRMLSICETYANDHKILFNAKKSQVLFFPSKKGHMAKATFHLNNAPLLYVNQAKHLGHMLSVSTRGVIDLSLVMSAFSKSVNILMAQLGSVSSNLLVQLFNQYCCCLYCIVLGDLSSKIFDKLATLWRKSVRRILCVSNRTHNRLLMYISNGKNMEQMAMSHVLKFYMSMFNKHTIK